MADMAATDEPKAADTSLVSVDLPGPDAVYATDFQQSKKGIFPLLDLPAELRNRIYEYAIISPEPRLLPSACKHDDQPSAEQPAITKLNRQVRKETISMFYSQNRFAYHLHLCDFEFFFEWMSTIGLQNRSNIQMIILVLKDRWTCGNGLLDFVRWCVKTQGTGKMMLDYNARDWQTEHRELLNSSEQTALALDLEHVSGCMVDTYNMLVVGVDLASQLDRERRISERQIRCAWERKVIENDWDCNHGIVGYCDSKTGRSDVKLQSYAGFCTSQARLVKENASLAEGCKYSSLA